MRVLVGGPPSWMELALPKVVYRGPAVEVVPLVPTVQRSVPLVEIAARMSSALYASVSAVVVSGLPAAWPRALTRGLVADCLAERITVPPGGPSIPARVRYWPLTDRLRWPTEVEVPRTRIAWLAPLVVVGSG